MSFPNYYYYFLDSVFHSGNAFTMKINVDKKNNNLGGDKYHGTELSSGYMVTSNQGHHRPAFHDL